MKQKFEKNQHYALKLYLDIKEISFPICLLGNGATVTMETKYVLLENLHDSSTIKQIEC